MHQARPDLGGREKARGRTNALAWGRLWHCRPGESAGTRAPPLRYARRVPVVLFSSLESGQDLNPWLRAAASVFAVLALPGWQGPQPRPSGTLLAGRPCPACAPLGRSKPHPKRPLPGQSRGARRLLQLQIRSLPMRGCQYSDHSTALLPLSTVTTWEPAGDQATALMDELQRERWGHG